MLNNTPIMIRQSRMYFVLKARHLLSDKSIFPYFKNMYNIILFLKHRVCFIDFCFWLFFFFIFVFLETFFLLWKESWSSFKMGEMLLAKCLSLSGRQEWPKPLSVFWGWSMSLSTIFRSFISKYTIIEVLYNSLKEIFSRLQKVSWVSCLESLDFGCVLIHNYCSLNSRSKKESLSSNPLTITTKLLNLNPV